MNSSTSVETQTVYVKYHYQIDPVYKAQVQQRTAACFKKKLTEDLEYSEKWKQKWKESWKQKYSDPEYRAKYLARRKEQRDRKKLEAQINNLNMT